MHKAGSPARWLRFDREECDPSWKDQVNLLDGELWLLVDSAQRLADEFLHICELRLGAHRDQYEGVVLCYDSDKSRFRGLLL